MEWLINTAMQQWDIQMQLIKSLSDWACSVLVGYTRKNFWKLLGNEAVLVAYLVGLFRLCGRVKLRVRALMWWRGVHVLFLKRGNRLLRTGSGGLLYMAQTGVQTEKNLRVRISGVFHLLWAYFYAFLGFFNRKRLILLRGVEPGNPLR